MKNQNKNKEPKKAKRIYKTGETTLKDGDWKFLSKMFSLESKDMRKFIVDCTDILYDLLLTNQMLLADLYEARGMNPLNYCKTLLYYSVYYHTSLTSNLPGLSVRLGKVYDADGHEIPYPELYAAEENGKLFVEALSEQYKRDNAQQDDEKEN